MEKLTLIKVGGKIVEEPDTLHALLRDFAAIEGRKLLVTEMVVGDETGRAVGYSQPYGKWASYYRCRHFASGNNGVWRIGK